MPEGLEDVSKYPNLFAALLTDPARPWTREELAKLASGNVLRVLRQVEEARDLLSEEEPRQGWIPLADLGRNTKCTSDVQERKEAERENK